MGYFDNVPSFDSTDTANALAEADKSYQDIQTSFLQEEAKQAQEQADYAKDPIGYMERTKAAKIAEKQARMTPLNNLFATDPDNMDANVKGQPYDVGKNFRLTGSDMGFDGYETKKPKEWFNKLSPKSQEAYSVKMVKQMEALDRAKGLPIGTSTIEDVYAKGAEQQDKLMSLMDKALLQDPNAKVEMVPTGKEDKSGGGRNIVKPMINGVNIIDQFANDPKENAGYFERYNKNTNKRKQDIRKANAYKPEPKDALTDAELNTVSGRIKQGITKAKASVKDIAANTVRTLSDFANDKYDAFKGVTARDKAMAKEIELDKADNIPLDKEQKKFLAGKKYDYPYWDNKYGTKNDKQKEAIDKLPTGPADIMSPSKNLRQAAEVFGKLIGNDNKDTAKASKTSNEWDKFREGIKEYDGSVIRKNQVNNNEGIRIANEDKRNAIEHVKNASAIAESFKKHDVVGTLENLAKEAKTIGKDVKNVFGNPGHGVESFMESVPHMALMMTGTGTGVAFSNTLNDMDQGYKKNHGGKSATGVDKVGQVVLATGITAVQKGASEVMLGGLAKKMGFKPTIVKTKHNQYKAYVPESLSKVASGEASTVKFTPRMEKLVDKFFASASTKLAFSKNKVLNSLAKGTGIASYDLAKRMFYGSMALGVNAGRVATGAASEYGEEFVESVLGDLGANIGTNKSIDFMKAHMAGLAGARGGVGGKVATVGVRAPVETLISAGSKSLYTGRKVKPTVYSSVTFENDTAQANMEGNTRTVVKGKSKVTDSTAPSALPGQAIDPRAVDDKYTFDPSKDTVDKFTNDNNAIDDLIANPHKVGNAAQIVTGNMLTAIEHQVNKVKETTDEDKQLDEYEKLATLKGKFEEFQKSQKEYVANINKATKDKKVTEYDELDVVNHLAELGTFNDETLNVLESRGVLSKQAKELNASLKEINKRAEATAGTTITSEKIVNGRGTNEITKADRNDPENTTGPSLKDYTTMIAKAVAKGDIKKAKKLTSSLKAWSIIHNAKAKKFAAASAKGEGATWKRGKQTYTPEATARLAKIMSVEADLITAHKQLAEHALASAELRNKRVENANAGTGDVQSKLEALLKDIQGRKNNTATDTNTNTDTKADTVTGSAINTGSVVDTIKANFAKIKGTEGSRAEKVGVLFKDAVTAVVGHSKTTETLSTQGTNVVPDGSKLTSKDVLGVVMPRAFGANATLKTKEEFKAKVADIRASVSQAIANGVDTIILDKTDKSALPDGSVKGNTRLDVTLRKAGFIEDPETKGLWTRNASNNNNTNGDTKATIDTTDKQTEPVANDPTTLLNKKEWGVNDLSEAESILSNAESFKKNAKAKGTVHLLSAIQQLNSLKARVAKEKENKPNKQEKPTKPEKQDKPNKSNKRDPAKVAKVLIKQAKSPKSAKEIASVLKAYPENLLYLMTNKVDKKTINKYKRAIAVLKNEDMEKNTKVDNSNKLSSVIETDLDYSKVEHGDDINNTGETGILTEEYVIDKIRKHNQVIGNAPEPGTSSVPASKRNKRTTDGESVHRVDSRGKVLLPNAKKKAHNAQAFLNADIQNGQELAQWLIANSTKSNRIGALDRILLKAVLNYFEKVGRVPKVVVEELIPHPTETGKQWNKTRNNGKVNPGSFDPLSNTITIRINKKMSGRNFVYGTGIHELLHAASVYTMKEDSSLVSDLQDMIDHIRATVSKEDLIDPETGKEMYGLSLPQEFIAELSKPKFREFLAKIPALKGKDTYRNFSGLLGNVMKVFHTIMSKITGKKYVDNNMLLEALRIFDKASLNGLTNEKDIVNNMFDLQVKGAILGSNVNAMKDVEANLQPKYNKVSKVGALSVFHNALSKINVLADKYGLNEVQVNFLHKARAFSANQRNAIKNTIASFDPKITKNKSKYLSGKVLLSIADGDLNNLPDNWFHAIGTQSMRFLAEEANRMRITDLDQIRKMFNLPDGAPLDYNVAKPLFDAGMKVSEIAEKLGKNIADELNIGTNRFADDPTTYDKLIMDLGTVALVSMEDMGLLEFTPVYQKYINKLLPKSRQSDNPDAYVIFVKPKMEYDVDTNTLVPTAALAELQQSYKDLDGSDTLAAIGAVGNNSKHKEVQDEPITAKDVPTRIPKTFMKTPIAYVKSIVNASKFRWKINTTRSQRWANVHPDVQAQILGLKNPDDHLEIYRDSIVGKNTNVLRSIETLKDFIAKRSEKDALDKPFSLVPTIWSQMRMGYRERDINFQQDKLHRQMVVGSTWNHTYDTKNEEDMDLFDKVIKVRLGESWKDYVNEDGSFVHKSFETAKAVLEGERTGKKVSKSVAKALDILGEGIEGFAILTNLIDLSTALKEGGKFESTLYAEPDGNTNGSITASMQTVLDRHDSNFRRATEAGGIFSEGSMFNTLTDYKKDNLDNYQDIIKRMAQKLRDKMPTLNDKYGEELIDAFNVLDTLVLSPMTEKGNPNAITKEGRNWAKPFVMTFIYSKQAESMYNDTKEILKEAIYEFIDKNKDNTEALTQLDKALKTLNKASSPEHRVELPNLVKLQKAGAIKKVQLPDVDKLLAPMSTVLKGEPVVDALEQSYESLVAVRNLLNTGFKAAYHYAAQIYEIEYDIAARLKAEEQFKNNTMASRDQQWFYDNVQLNRAEEDELITRLIDAGAMPSIKHASSTGYADSLLLTNMRKIESDNKSLVPLSKPLRKEGLYDIDKNGDPVFKKQTTTRSSIGPNGSKVTVESEGINTITNRTPRRVLSAEGLGFRKFVNVILSFDGNVQNRAMQDSRIGEFGNIHDAIIVPGHKMQEATVAQNQNYIHLMAEWDLLEESLATLKRMEEHKVAYLSAYPNYKGKFKDIPAREGEKVVQLSDVLTDFEPMVKKHIKQKIMHLKELTNVEQFEAYEVRHNAKEDAKLQAILNKKITEAEDKFGITFDDQVLDDQSYDDYENAISYDSQDYFKKQIEHPVGEINPATVEENFAALRQLDTNLNTRIDDKHSVYLEHLVQNMSQNLKSVADGIKLEVYKGKSKVSNIAKVKASSKKIKLSISDGLGIDDNRGIESNQEAFARGYIEAVVNNAVKADKSLLSDLTKLFNNIMDNKEITWKDLLYDKQLEHYTDEAKALAEELAKERFDQIFFEKNLGKFVGLILTNKKVMDKLSDIDPSSSYSKGHDLTPVQQANNALLKAKNSIFDNSTNEVVRNTLADALNVKNKFNTKLTEFHPFSDELNAKVHSVVKKQLYDRVLTAVDKIDPNHSFFTGKTLLHKVASPIKAIGSLGVIAADVYHNPALVEYYVDIANDINKQFGEFFNNMKLEFLGQTDKNYKFHNMLRQVKHHVDAQQNVIASGTTDQLRGAFLKENRPTSEQWASLTRTVINSDLGVLLGNYNMSEVLTVLENKKSMQAEIDIQMDIIKRILPANLHDAIDVHTSGLAHYMRTKENRVEGLRANASAMAYQFKEAANDLQWSSSDTKRLANAIDMVVTVKALQMNKKSDLKYLYNLMRAESTNPNNGVVMLSQMHQSAQEMNKELLFRSNSKRIKGDIRRTHTNNYQSIVVPKKEVKKRIAQGYTVYKEVSSHKNSDVIMYTNRTNYNKFITGIVSISSDSYGKTVSYTPDKYLNLSRAKASKDKIYPIIAYNSHGKKEEIVHTPTALYDIGGSETDASILVGNDMAYSTVSNKARRYNKKAVKALYADYKEQVTNEDNKLIEFNSKTHPDIWDSLPYKFKKDLIEAFGDEKLIKVDRDYITLVFGFKTRSLSGLIDDKHETTKKIVYHAERIWQQMVARAKEHVVIYTPQVLISNIASNAVLSVVQGIPPGYMLKEQKNALAAVSDYRRTLAKRNDTERLLRMKANKNDIFLKKKLNKLNNLLKSNVVHKLVEEGVFTSYIEDIDNRDVPLLSAIDEAVGDLRKDGNNRKLRNIAEKGSSIPYIGTAYKNLVIAKDTNLAKDLRYATQVSDFVARYAMYKYRTEVQNKSHDDSIAEVMETFVNYEWNTSNELQWINDMGIMMYTKFLFRIQKVLLKSFRDRPINNVASILLQDATMNVPDISDSFISGAFSTGRVNNPADIVDDAFELNLLHYLPFF